MLSYCTSKLRTFLNFFVIKSENETERHNWIDCREQRTEATVTGYGRAS
jgi:hypothetical protein